MIIKPSPNCGPRNSGFEKPTMLVIHYTDMPTSKEALLRLCDPTSSVSAHYLIDEEGTVYQMVDECLRAWHAGASYWRGCTDVNSASIGIELVNPGHTCGYKPFPTNQMQALIQLSKNIVNKYHITPLNVVAHSDIAPTRKKDPGELFDWNSLAQEGVGIMPSPFFESNTIANAEAVLKALLTIGYNPADLENHPTLVIEAFCRHYLPDYFVKEVEYQQILAVAKAVCRENSPE